MVPRQFLRGNEALAFGALHAGLNAFFGYPITPSSEIPETLAKQYTKPEFPEFKAFLQSASELEAANMAIGAASTGARVMMATSGPGLSLKQEGISYASGMELPLLIVNVNRSGPGLGNLGPEQSDYFQVTRGGGHGCSRNIVIAPNSVQEMAVFPSWGFSLAFKYRNPVVILADAFLGELKEDIVFPRISNEKYNTSWATTGATGNQRHLLLSLNLELEDQSKHLEKLEAKYNTIDRLEARCDSYLTDDADTILVAFGIVSRVCLEAINKLRSKGIKAGLFRPMTLSPFPGEQLRKTSEGKKLLVVELSMGQMLYDVKLAVGDSARVNFLHRLGGLLPTSDEIVQKVSSFDAK